MEPLRLARHARIRTLASIALAVTLATGWATSPAAAAEGVAGAGAGAPGADDESVAVHAGLGAGAVLASLLYAPVKVAYAATGALFGGFAWAYSGGEREVAEGVIGPAVHGDYLILPEHLRQPATIDFFGRRPAAGWAWTPGWAWGSGEDAAAADGGGLPPVAAAAPTDCASLDLPTVHFEFGRAALTRSGESTVDLVAEALRRCPSIEVRIEAHADWVGTSKDNQRLSERRAEVVRRHLVQRGVAESRLDSASYGEARPIAPNVTPEGRALNRRAELQVR